MTQPTLDLLPTLCDLAGISVPVEKPGISLAPTLKGEKQKKTHPYVVSEWHSEYEYVVTPGRMVRGPRYKYTHYLEGNGEELYDMKKIRENVRISPKIRNTVKFSQNTVPCLMITSPAQKMTTEA